MRKRKAEDGESTKRFACQHPGCNDSFDKENGLRRHLATHKTDTNRTKKPDGLLTSTTQESQILQPSKKPKNTKVPCPVCAEVYSTSQNAAGHVAQFHPEFEWFLCPESGCGSKYLTAELLQNHSFRHRDKKSFPCPSCGKKYGEARSQAHHLRTQHPEYQFHLCQDCGKEYATVEQLARHEVREHNMSEEDRLPCDFPGCGKSFKKSSSLDEHKLDKHGSETIWFLCQEADCQMRFETEYQLKRHNVTDHNGATSCPICRAELFDDIKELISHMKKSHDFEHKNNVYTIYNWDLFRPIIPPFKYFDILDQSKTEEDASAFPDDEDDFENDDDDGEDMNMYSPSLLAFIKLRNEAFVSHWSAAYQGFKMLEMPYSTNDSEYCIGTQDQPCPFNHLKVSEISYLRIRRGHFNYSTRCVLCSRVNNRIWIENKHAEREISGLCFMKCDEPRLEGSVFCEKHIESRKQQFAKWGLDRVLRERKADPRRQGKAKHILDSSDLYTYLDSRGLRLTQEKERQITKLRNSIMDERVFYVDTEFLGSTILEICVLDHCGSVVLDTKVDYGITRKQLWDKVFQDPGSSSLSLGAISRKLYSIVGAPREERMSGSTTQEIAQVFKSLNIADAILVEWSTSQCDYSRIFRLFRESGNTNLLPPLSRSQTSIPIWRQGLPGVLCFRLSYIFSLVFPEDQELAVKAHRAQPDARMLYMLTQKLIEFVRV